MDRLSEGAKLKLLCLSLLLILGLLAFTTIETVQAMRSFQHQYSAVKRGDVSTVHPWMTVHVISHVYNVPEAYLGDKLTISGAYQLRHTTLYEIAAHQKQPVDRVVHTVQQAILVYRQNHHSTFSVPVMHPFLSMESFLPLPGRLNG